MGILKTQNKHHTFEFPKLTAFRILMNDSHIEISKAFPIGEVNQPFL